MKISKGLIIAVDFDGTIVEDAYPSIGDERLFAFDTLKRLQADGHRLILWTYRHGKKLEEAVEYCKANGIEFYAVNKSFPEEQTPENVSRKIHADLFIDDRNIGGILGWGEIYQMLTNEQPKVKQKKKKGFFRF
ncbi:BT0820 family HAD-type phosphatase [Lacinutrix sp. MedPE-SW]|uniref:BT0820 family HAD-type phosphatase n=1 Tax=Lacinutrix sp. MedPE-SW TaxID=1860087 RepID=UPI000910A63C|nr:hydrolase [Lacinutrix sp. MedPE-SW]OIQ18148.1 MAG: hydrolase [Lacinutrix sp. MedPE-SW]